MENIKIKFDVEKAMNEVERVLTLSKQKLAEIGKKQLRENLTDMVYICSEESSERIFGELAAVWTIDIIQQNDLDLCDKYMLILSNGLMNSLYYSYIGDVIYIVLALYIDGATENARFSDYQEAIEYYNNIRNVFNSKLFSIFSSLWAVVNDNEILLMNSPMTSSTMLYEG